MKYTITIPEPCHEKWHLMTPTEKGRFCASCEKEVFDFTHTSTYQLADLLDKNKSVCWRFRQSQLNKEFSSNKNNGLQRTSLIFGFTSLLTFCTALEAQENLLNIEQHTVPIAGKVVINKVLKETVPRAKTIQGSVLDDSNQPLPGANIVLEGTPYEPKQILMAILIWMFLGSMTK